MANRNYSYPHSTPEKPIMSTSDCSSGTSTDPKQLKTVGISLVGLSTVFLLLAASLDDGVRVLGLTITQIALIIPVPVLGLSGAALAVWADISAAKEKK